MNEGGQGEMDESEIYRFPEFFDRLDRHGSLQARDAVESHTDVDGLVYHHRGLQIPADAVVFTAEPDGGSTDVFRVDVDGVNGRRARVRFDRGLDWNVYLMLFDGGAVIAWMNDAEFTEEEAAQFDTMAAAILAGRFSFGTFFVFGPDWVERKTWGESSDAPALLQVGTGEVLEPESPTEFDELGPAIPEEFRSDETVEPANYFGVIDCKLTIERD